jgi:GH15 family glucan-1,4-alpha-glucosidase
LSHQPIENYGIIGNMRTVALVGMNGSIDWYCYPQFDSPSIFGAILDDKKGGRFQISADADGARHKQFYWPSTNVLVTRFLLGDGIAELEDFMPAGSPPTRLGTIIFIVAYAASGVRFAFRFPVARLSTMDDRPTRPRSWLTEQNSRRAV